MIRRLVHIVSVVAPMAFSAPVVAQAAKSAIPTRALGSIKVTSTDSLGAQVVVRALSNGSVMVNDIMRRRVLLFEPTLATHSVVIDSGSTTGNAMSSAVASSQLMRYTADSTLYVDVATQALLVIDAAGKVARVMALPKPTDAFFIATPQFGTASIDPQGRLMYRGMILPKIVPPEPGSKILMSMPQQSDSGPILRADFDTRKVDTVTTLKVLQPGAMTLVQDGQNVAMKMVVNPMDTGDEWGMLPDGTIAILRAHDYHIDWVAPDGKRTSSPKMAFDWKVMTDEQKQFKLDSMRPLLQKAIDDSPGQSIPTAEGPRKIKIQFDFVPLNKLPDYEPPIAPGAMKVDRTGNLWIVPRTSSGANGGLLYDVVNRRGEVFERVQFPKGYALAGFGNADEVYLLRVVGKVGFLERASIR
ncbi:MAG: hypothetical protein H7Z40_14340 [Phycisphaerae bacterium]|nr:hypothetical protein [Gemmatimonadaceae bacterium]